MSDKLTLPIWIEIIIEILKKNGRSTYCETLGRKGIGSLTHIRKLVKTMEKNGLIEIIQDSKINKISITDKGIRVATALMQIKTEI